MNIAAVSHRATIEYCYALDGDTVVVNIRTGKDVDRAYIISEDPFIHELRGEERWSGVRSEMSFLAELKYHYLWTARLKPKYKRLRYYFELESEGEAYVVCENKICPAEENDRESMQYFKYAWLNISATKTSRPLLPFKDLAARRKIQEMGRLFRSGMARRLRRKYPRHHRTPRLYQGAGVQRYLSYAYFQIGHEPQIQHL